MEQQNGRLTKIYNSSPIWIQNIMTSAKGFLNKKARTGGAYKDYLQIYLHRDYSDRNAMLIIQKEEFSELLLWAFTHSPFYREYYKNCDIERIATEFDLAALPVLPKETVRKNIAQMYAINEKNALKSNTSGTTGTPMCFWATRDDSHKRMAYLDAFKIQHGFYPYKMRAAHFNASMIVPPNQKKKIFWRDNLPCKQRIYSAYWCNHENAKCYLENLNQYKPQALSGYPSAIYALAKYVIENNFKLTFCPIAVFPTAETLYPDYKKTISEAFNCPVFDQYASSEGAPFITECKCGKLHYCMDTGIIEFLEDGRMLMTSFHTHGTPLIRYDIGDIAFLSKETQCGCGSCMPIVDHIEGRNMDYLQSAHNSRLPAIHLSIVNEKYANCIEEMQFIQNDIQSVDVNLKVDSTRYKDEMSNIIIDELHYSLGEDMVIRIHIVESIPRSPKGKYQLVVNNIKQGEK